MNDFHFSLTPLDQSVLAKKPRRTREYLILQVHHAEGELITDLHRRPLHPGGIYFIAPGQLVRIEGENKGLLLAFDPLLSHDVLKYLPPLFSRYIRENVLFPSDTDREAIGTLFRLLQKEQVRPQKDLTLIRSLLHALILYLARIKTGGVKKEYTWRQTRMAKIEELIETHFRREHFAPFYAARLHLSSQYLNRLLKKSLGKTLTQLIADRIMLEAKRELVHTTRTINEIAYDLGFPDPSYFSKFFKKQEARSPLDFRKKFRYYH